MEWLRTFQCIFIKQNLSENIQDKFILFRFSYCNVFFYSKVLMYHIFCQYAILNFCMLLSEETAKLKKIQAISC